ncbi:MAG: hypothetical protein JNM60_06815 [Candidatus Competibacteraceae bacterium]|nr:hypothetical protein [Candidatus Competibacteraceae bacterium]
MTDPSPCADRPEKRYWLDEPRHVDKIFYGLVGVCVLLLLSDLAYRKHATFGFESWFGFFAWYGFICCVALVLLAKQMRKLVKRDEDYYGD